MGSRRSASRRKPPKTSEAHAFHQTRKQAVALARALYLLSTIQIIQYINLVKSEEEPQSFGDSFTTSEGGKEFPWLPADDFEYDSKAGHGTHNAGSAAGAALHTPAETTTCEVDKTLSCAGGCIDGSALVTDDDLVSQSAQNADIDRLCPAFGCNATENQECLSDDVSETLTNNGGMAQGAKLAVFDVFFGEVNLAPLAGNGVWDPCIEAGCKLHSNSWGSDTGCEIESLDTLYDLFMYEVSKRESHRRRSVGWFLERSMEHFLGK